MTPDLREPAAWSVWWTLKGEPQVVPLDILLQAPLQPFSALQHRAAQGFNPYFLDNANPGRIGISLDAPRQRLIAWRKPHDPGVDGTFEVRNLVGSGLDCSVTRHESLTTLEEARYQLWLMVRAPGADFPDWLENWIEAERTRASHTAPEIRL